MFDLQSYPEPANLEKCIQVKQYPTRYLSQIIAHNVEG